MNNLLEEIKVVLRNENDDKDFISIGSIYKLITKLMEEYEGIKNYYSNLFSDVLKRYGVANKCIVNNFDFIYQEVSVSVQNIYTKEWDEFRISYMNDTVKIDASGLGSLDKDRIFKLLSLDLYDLYEQFMKYHEMYFSYVSSLTTDNDNFLVDIDKYGVSLRDNNNKFQVSLYNFINNFCYETGDNEVKDIILGNEEEIFKRIFFKIEDMPVCIRQMLYMSRLDELVSKNSTRENKGIMKRIKSIFRKKGNN